MRLKKRGNPFYAPFLGVVITCCILLSIISFVLGYMNEKKFIQQYATEKAEQVLEDWEIQLQQMKEVALRIVSDYTFHPAHFQQSISNELSMLADFQKYKEYSVLVDEYFLECGTGRIFCSGGNTIDFEFYLKSEIESDEGCQLFKEEIAAVKEELSGVCGNPKVISVFDQLYVLIPIRMYTRSGTENAVLCFTVSKNELKNRINIVGSYMEGEIALYGDEAMLYSNSAIPCKAGQKGVIAVASSDGSYTICYRPELKSEVNRDLFLFSLMLILTDLILIVVLSNVFSKKAYAPVQVLAEKYRQNNLDSDIYHENAIEEIRYMLDDILEKNTAANAQIQKSQKEIRSQLLRMMLDSRTLSEILPRMEKAKICLPGPNYRVMSISFMHEEGATEGFLGKLQEEIELIPEEEKAEYCYTICDDKKKLITIVISASSEESENALLETICDVVTSFSFEPGIGIGNTCSSIRNLSASYLESVDEILNRKGNSTGREQTKFVYENDNLRKISVALECGNEKLALESLEEFVKKHGEGPVSMLMMQYIVADFLGEMRKHGDKYNIEMSKTNSSLLVSSRDMMDFRAAAVKIIHEFCEKQESIRTRMEEEASSKILAYIQENFMQYDISIEKVADELKTTTDAVRLALQKHTGKGYRDYLIFLRIEHAKMLLLQEDISIADLCQKIGYGNVSYFIKLFRQTVGITPAQYRKSMIVSKDYDSKNTRGTPQKELYSDECEEKYI